MSSCPKRPATLCWSIQPMRQALRPRRKRLRTQRALGLDALFFNASTPAEIDAAFAAFGRERADALFIAGDAFFFSRAVQFATLAVRDRMPASYATREMVEAGLLMSYGTIFLDML